MQHLRDLQSINIPRAEAAVGTFDGVHRGHAMLLSSMVTSAHNLSLPAVVVTFWPHPAVVLRGLANPYVLTMPEERAELFGKLGVDYVLTLPFDIEMAAQSPDEFMQRLVERTGISKLWLGPDFALGRGRKGNGPYLSELGERLGYTVAVVHPLASDKDIISSTRIRKWLSDGQVVRAGQELGRWYQLTGLVVHGDGRGRKINIPTANLSLPPEKLLPANGVYATRAWVDGWGFNSVTNIGVRPTFDSPTPSPQVETHIMEFTGDIYGQSLQLEFVARLRDEMKFNSVEALITQIKLDTDRAKEILTDARRPPNLYA